MAKNKKKSGLWAKIGVWSYIAGIVFALLLSIFAAGSLSNWAVGTLIVLGVVVGLINIAESEVQTFLIAAIAFIIAAGAMGAVFTRFGETFAALQTFMDAIIVFAAPGALIVSFKAIYDVAKDE